jgi:hypothetical protein
MTVEFKSKLRTEGRKVFFKSTEVVQNFWSTFFTEKSYVSNLTKNGSHFILGDFFHKIIRSLKIYFHANASLALHRQVLR